MGEQVTGRVRMFNEIVGSGFIDPDTGTGIIRFSYRDILKTGYRALYEGQRVVFELHHSSRGPIARNIVPDDFD